MNNNAKGLSISFVLHGAILYAFMSITALLPATEMVKVIDFSLVAHLNAPQKEPAKSAPALPPPPAPAPTLKPVVKNPEAQMVSKIPVPVLAEEAPIAKQEPAPEPMPVVPVVAETVNEAVGDETRVAVLPKTETTASPPPVAAESAGQPVNPTDPGIADEGVSKGLYVEANFHYIYENIQKSIIYPRLARKMGWEGKVIVSFVVGKDGNIQDVHIVESSGFAALDKNAIDTIKKAAPYPCPTVSAELVVPVIYRLA